MPLRLRYLRFVCTLWSLPVCFLPVFWSNILSSLQIQTKPCSTTQNYGGGVEQRIPEFRPDQYNAEKKNPHNFLRKDCVSWCKIYCIPQRSQIEIKQEQPATCAAAKEIWRSGQHWFPPVDALFNVSPNMKDMWECVASDGYDIWSICVYYDV